MRAALPITNPPALRDEYITWGLLLARGFGAQSIEKLASAAGNIAPPGQVSTTVDESHNTTVSVQTAPDTWKDVVVLQNHDIAIKVLFDDKHAVVTAHD